MNYYSTNRKAKNVNFSEAVRKGLAPDNGLYFPESISPLPASFFENIESMSNHEIAFEAIRQFVGGEIPENDLKTLVEEVLSFDFPLVKVEDDVYSLELFHGPTMAFKDVGGRFMARCLGYFNRNETKQVTVLVATSGDTGGAVASGFLGVKGVDVVILYPKGKVSEIQEKQLTTLGQNITALEVEGTFDDCQRMVKAAFVDEELKGKINLTSANSINVARFLPQMFYFFFAYRDAKKLGKEVVFSIPSGNYGNITGGLFAKQLGLPIEHFVASSNANDIVPVYLNESRFEPKPSVQTISNAMDVGNPSNFARMLELYDQSHAKMSTDIAGYSYTDAQTKACMKEVKDRTGYVLDPHGAVGYLGLKDYLKDKDAVGIFLETAHPVKFLDVVEDAIGEKQPLPQQIQEYMKGEKSSILVSKDYEDLKGYLLSEKVVS